MKIIHSVSDLAKFLSTVDSSQGYLADTGFLYAVAFDDDRLHNSANEILDLLADQNIPLFANVISRMEFVDLMFRKLVTKGAIQVFESMTSESVHKNTWNLLKNIRDLDTADRRQNKSYKINEGRLKDLRAEFENVSNSVNWKAFCNRYVDQKLLNEWTIVEEDLGLNFIEIMEGQISDHFNSPLVWSDMIRVMGEQGLRGPDAMIANLFVKSKFPLLITNDSDFEKCFSDPLEQKDNKAIFLL